MRHGVLAARIDAAPHALRMADRPVDHARVRLRRALGHSQVFAHILPGMQHALHARMRHGIERNGHQPACALIQAADGPVDKIRRAAQAGIYRVFQRGAVLPGAGNGGQRRRLIHNQDIRVPIRHAQRQIIGRKGRPLVPQLHHNRLPRRHSAPHMSGSTVQQDAVSKLQAAQPMLRQLKMRAQHIFQPAPRLLGRNGILKRPHADEGG